MTHSSPPQITLVDAVMTVSILQKFPKSVLAVSSTQEQSRLFNFIDKFHVGIFCEKVMGPNV